jgi:hypothetical protein
VRRGQRTTQASVHTALRFSGAVFVIFVLHGAHMSRGRRKRSLRDLSRDEPSPEDSDEIRRLQREGPGVVTAILGAAQVEYQLERLIFARLKRRDANTIEALTRDNGPLSGLYAKCVMAHAMGIIDDVILGNINIIRTIRNAFAHAKRPISFETAEVLDELRRIRLPPKSKSELYLDLAFAKKPSPGTGAASFRILVSNIIIQLLNKGTKRFRNRAAYLRRKAKRRGGGIVAGVSLADYENFRPLTGGLANALAHLKDKQ